ncbi:hypothetical protein N0V90_009445 [Kalmusia sp. IMI 367209]|nr:hypothetical protein N0V90_009445 [Kalmusia sp. IMI 367209]
MANNESMPKEDTIGQKETAASSSNDEIPGRESRDSKLPVDQDKGHEPSDEAEGGKEELFKEQQYEITREGDDLVIAVWKPAAGQSPSKDLQDITSAVNYGPWCTEFRDPRRITLRQFGGASFAIPYSLAVNWTWMKEIIKLAYGSDEDKKKEMDEGKFYLTLNSRSISLLPEIWNRTIEPWDHVTVTLESQKPGPPPPSESASESGSEAEAEPDESKTDDKKKAETVYQVKVKYRIDLFQKNRFMIGQENFLESRSYDEPVDLDKSRSRDKLVPVLEEINQIILGSEKNHIPVPGAPVDQLKDFNPEVDDKVKPKKLHIRSPLLLNALRSIVKYSSNPPLSDENDAFTDGLFPFPFMDLYNHRQEMLDFKKSTSGPRANHTKEYNDECDKHIDILIDYLDNEPTVQLKSIKERWEKKIPTTTFAGFWMLLKPGSDVYVKENDQLNAYVVDQVSGGIDYNPWFFIARSYSVRVWNLVYNGESIKRKSRIIEVQVFDGEREITSLPLFPTMFHDRLDDGALRKQLIERGRKFFRFTKGPTFLEYTGTGLKQGWRKYNRARVVVEHQSLPWLLNEFESNLSISTTFGDYDSIKPSQTEGLTDHQALVCMSHMFGFVLKERSYDILDLYGLTEPRLAESAIDELVLRPERNKTTIKAIARTYTESDSQADLFSVDFIRGKGEGQIFLLHGPPGTGKTLTAESVAEYTKRPLLSITAADLGHEPVELERNLLRFFKNATAWDAIVLLDEADVYLERRSSNDLRRNSVVSRQFDEAFLSRIHVSIGYDPLDDKAREQIWDTLFKKLKSNHKNGGPRIDYEYEAKQYVRKDPDVRKLQWNGREIRNGAFRNIIHHKLVESMPMDAFTATSQRDRSIVESFLRVHFDLLLKRRSTIENDFHWLMHLLIDPIIAILDHEDCSTQDPLGQLYMQELNNYLATTAKEWAIRRLVRDGDRDFTRDYPLGITCIAVVIDSLEAVKHYLARGQTIRRYIKRMNTMQHADFDTGDAAFDHPLLVAVVTGKTRILHHFLNYRAWPGYHEWDIPLRSLYQAFRIAIDAKQCQAIAMLHKFIVRENGRPLLEQQYYDCLQRAAKTEDIATFRIVVHLAALNSDKSPLHGAVMSKSCEGQHEDLIWWLLKKAIMNAGKSEETFPISVKRATHLISFIIAYYAALLRVIPPSDVSLLDAVVAGDLKQVKLLLQRGEKLSDQELWRIEWELRRLSYDYGVFKNWEDEAAVTNHNNSPSNFFKFNKDTLVTMYLAYKVSDNHRGRRKVKLQHFAKHVEKNVPGAKRMRLGCIGGGYIERDIGLVETAKKIAKSSLIVVIPSATCDEGEAPPVMACGVKLYYGTKDSVAKISE